MPPVIPDHDVLRCIGRGSYGEVWMARAVTGVLRAVKVIRRDDFELERTFEREFEGIRSYEPLSRSHPGLIDILHVGRNPAAGFYYYVMELADDRYKVRQFSPGDYEPRSLSTDRKDGAHLDIDRIIEVGLLLADALAHLHQHGLIHRDVKPSNIIFVDGVAQLADIGLVAAYGQRTYVGTEGYVSPEGPGTPQADTYSLGMVLYELSTGKDRLEFPAVPDDLSSMGDLKKWRALNEVVCKACAHDPKDRFADARAMAQELRRILQGKPRRRSFLRRKRVWISVAVGAAFFVQHQKNTALQKFKDEHLGTTPPVGEATPPEFVGPPAPRFGKVSVSSEPAGAKVLIDGNDEGVTPLDLANVVAGEHQLTVRLPEHRDYTEKLQVGPTEPAIVQAALSFWSPPQPGKPWKNSQGLTFKPSTHGGHEAVRPTSRDEYVQATGGQFLEGEVLAWQQPGRESSQFIVFVPKADAENYCAWIEQEDQKKGFLGPDHYYRLQPVTSGIDPTQTDDTADNLAFKLVVGLREFGDVTVNSTPEGAQVIENGVLLGTTPLSLKHRLTGPLNLEIKLAGYNTHKVAATLKAGQKLIIPAALETSRVALFDRPWTNSLGMKFHPVDGLQYAIWETRLQDYQAFVEATGREYHSDLDQAANHPVVSVSRKDAMAFCEWLTEKDLKAGLLEPGSRYRLPTDVEWSRVGGCPKERGTNPKDRESRIRGVFPWGYEWPPPPTAGNLADQSAAASKVSVKKGQKLLPHNDSYAFTAPVGSFSPSPDGLFDLAGNVAEWVSDDFDSGADIQIDAKYGVVRGGSWASFLKAELFSSFRNSQKEETRDPLIGFRVVLAAPEKGGR